jgi:hypothetical protein
MLDFFSMDYPAPKDTDLTLGAFAKEQRPPLALLPLSESEIRLLNMSSINSEGNRRTNFRENKNKPRGDRFEKHGNPQPQGKI